MGSKKNYKSRQQKHNDGKRAGLTAVAILWLVMAVLLIAARDAGTGALIRWLLACLAVSMCTKPLLMLKGLNFCDEGFSLGFGFGTAVSFTAVWYLCTVMDCTFGTFTCVTGLILIAFISFIVQGKKGYFKENRRRADFETIMEQRRRFCFGFTVFAFLMVIAFWVKGYKPLIDFQTEQYMDFGFMNAMYRQQRLPFEDIWFAGNRVNYYYLGQAVAVYICRLSGVTPEYGYNLALCTLFASLTMSVYTLTEAFLRSTGALRKVAAIIGGTAASLMCAFGGNGHWIIYGIIKQIYYKLAGLIPESSYWFASSTLFIGYAPETMDKGKHEFPAYTLVLGDLHAHVCNMLFTIPLLAVLFDYAVSSSAEDSDYDLIKDICTRHTVMAGFLLGVFKGVNYWDFPIYFVVSGAVILFCDIRRYGFKLYTVAKVLIKGAFILAVSALVNLPFYLTFNKPVSGIHLCDNHSPVDKLVIIWFAHVIMAVTLLLIIAVRRSGSESDAPESGKHFTPQELTMLAVTLCGLGLLLMPEVIYVKDIYGESYQRYNTMFKLTFQGFILLSISAGCCIGLLLDKGLNLKREHQKFKGTVLRIVAYVYCFVVLLLGAYMGWSVKAWFGNVFKPANRVGISATEFIESNQLYDNVREAIKILNEDSDRNLHIIEEAGTSYSPESKVSVFTGACTPAGWYVHEWLWNNSSEVVGERHGEVSFFYTGGDEEYCREFAKKYKLDYIYVGPKTLEKYDVDYNGFILLGKRVWDSSDGKCMLIKVDKEKL